MTKCRKRDTKTVYLYSRTIFSFSLPGTVVICSFQLRVCRFHLECEPTVGNIVVSWMDQPWAIAVTFWNRPHRSDWTEWRSWWCVWTNSFQTFDNSTKWCQHTAAVDKDHWALPIHHCQSMKTYMPILDFYPFWDSGGFGTIETVARTKLRNCGLLQLKIGRPLKLSGKIKYFDITNRNLKWEKEENLWASSYL